MIRSLFPPGLRVWVRSIDRTGVVREGINVPAGDRSVWLDEPWQGLRSWSINIFDLVAEPLHTISQRVLTALQGQWEDDGWIAEPYLLNLAEIDDLDDLESALQELAAAGYTITFQREAAGDFYRLDPKQKLNETNHPTVRNSEAV